METIKIDLKKYRGLWKNLVNATLAPMTRDEYTKLNPNEQDVVCDDLHIKLESTFGFKILYSTCDGRPSSAYAKFLEFSDAQKVEYFINNIIPKYMA